MKLPNTKEKIALDRNKLVKCSRRIHGTSLVDSKEAYEMIGFLLKLVFYPLILFALVLKELIKRA